MKINPIGIVAAILVIGAVVYYLHHHQINIDVKGDNKGNKSHTSIKHDVKHDKHANDANA
ncbi:MAG: hypothetical protein JO129_03475 [Candidatus Dependentiae bacterium]|nr:hypothetical protein [Candidatus Dependentiae bacterium]